MTSPHRLVDHLKMEQVSARVHLARTPHVNWVIYVGDDGVTLIDSGYPGQYELLERSLEVVGATPRLRTPRIRWSLRGDRGGHHNRDAG